MVDAPEPRPVDDESSDAPSDEDFAPSGASIASSEGDSSADETAQAPATGSGTPRKRKRLIQTAKDQDPELDSGDEVTIRRGQERKERKRAKQESAAAGKGRKKKKGKSKAKGGKKAGAAEDEDASDDLGLSDEDDEGEGGLIKTRSQRKAEKQTRQRRPLYPIGQATADIDSIWSRLSGLGVGRHKPADPSPDANQKDASSNALGPKGSDAPDDEMITITRTYTFAGEDKTETKRVSKHSAEGKLWLASHPEGKDTQEQPENVPADPAKPLNRPLRRASRFDGNPTGEIKALPPHLQSYWRDPLTIAKIADAKRRGSGVAIAVPSAPTGGTKAKGKTKDTRPGALNTVEKSRLDWVGYVDKSGIQNELEVYGKGKEGYLDRMNFLDRMADKRDEAGRSKA